MKIGIITQPLGLNYGGILQNYALQTVLKRMGHDVWTIDYKKFTWMDWLDNSWRECWPTSYWGIMSNLERRPLKGKPWKVICVALH